MKILLATGIFPPDIGGPATYVEGLARELARRKHEVTVVTYGREGSGKREAGSIVRVRTDGGMFRRWKRYSEALKTHGTDADAIIAFSSVSTGIPLLLSRLKTPKKILRLGGEFFWERYTDHGGRMGLAAWHRSKIGLWRILNALLMPRILRAFTHVVYSTELQRALHRRTYRKLPPSSVIENPVPSLRRVSHAPHSPFSILFMGRLVRFKRVNILLEALSAMPDATLTVVGRGPEEANLHEESLFLNLRDRITFLPPLLGEAKEKIFRESDLLVIPSVTEISPNVALEAVSAGLPVLLSKETGLSPSLTRGMLLAPTDSKMELLSAIMKARSVYKDLASAPLPDRTWEIVAGEWASLLQA